MASTNTTNDPPKALVFGQTLGGSGTNIFRGFISNEEYNYRTTGKEGIKNFDIMRRSDASVRATLQIVKLPLLGLDRHVEPASQEDGDVFIAKFIENELFNRNINFNSMAREAMTFFDFGFSIAEKTFEMTEYEGKTLIGIKEIGFRKQTSLYKWEMLQPAGKPGITQQLVIPEGGVSTISIPREKLIVWTFDQEGKNYAGIPLLRYCFKDWDMKDKIGMIYAIGLERTAIPTPILKTPIGTQANDELAAEQAMMRYRTNESSYIKVPIGWEIDKFDLNSQGLGEIKSALEYFDRQIKLSVLGQFLDLAGSSSGAGSRALSQDHSKLFMQSEEAANKAFQDPLQEQLVKQLCDINFSNMPNGYPKLVSSRVQDDDVQILSDAMNKLTTASLITPTFETEQHLRDLIHLPELSEDMKADYDTKRQASLNNLTTPSPPQDIVKPNTDISNSNADKVKNTDTKTKAALESARIAQKDLIDIILG